MRTTRSITDENSTPQSISLNINNSTARPQDVNSACGTTGELEKRTIFRGDVPLDMLDVESSSARRGGVNVGDSFLLGTRKIRDTLICKRAGNIETDAER